MALRTPLLALLALLLGPAAAAQAPPTAECEVGTAEAELNVAGVRAKLYTIGGLFWRGSQATYEVPQGLGIDALFSASLMVGGLVEDELRFAGSTYGPWEFWPGPLDADARATTALCLGFDRIWTVTADDLARYADTGATTADLAAWPVGAGAPFFVDSDADGAQGDAEPTVALRPGDAGYDPARVIDLGAGERPVVFGAQTAWWVMNDLGGEHEWSEAPALGIEVRVTAWVPAERSELYYATVYRYEILNRSGQAIEDARMGFVADVELGHHNDDYIHTDPDRSMLVVYNGDETDESGGGYGAPPPALGIDVFSGADVGMFFTGGGTVVSDPGNGQEAYDYLDALWKDGTPLTVGDNGYTRGNAERTRWAFTGDPVTRAFWSEENVDGTGRANTPGDRRGVLAAHVGRWAPGEERTLDIGLLFAQGASRLGSVERVREVSDLAQAAYADGGLFRTGPTGSAPPPPTAPPEPTTAPAVSAPAAGAVVSERPVTFEWSAAAGATGYRLEIDSTDAFATPLVHVASETRLELAPTAFPPNQPDALVWRVVPLNGQTPGPPSDAREVTLYRYDAGPLTYRWNRLAFVEVVGPGGVDPCGPDASSTGGCAEVFGNAIYLSFNSTGDYTVTSRGDGPEASIGAFAPSEFEIRFTAEGSYAYYPYTTGALIRVPFEVWDVGPITPGQANDPSDDVQLIPGLRAEAPEAGADPVECSFGYVGPETFGIGPDTQQISAFYGDYAAFEAEAEAAVAADPDGCPSGPATAAAWSVAEPGRGRPLQNLVLVGRGGRDIEALEGAVIRFYTVDRVAVAEEARPDVAGDPALAVFPNPSSGRATVDYRLAAAGPVRLRVVDVLGREVAVLVDGDRAAGPHHAALATGALAAGIYVVVLDADGRRATRAITVAR